MFHEGYDGTTSEGVSVGTIRLGNYNGYTTGWKQIGDMWYYYDAAYNMPVGWKLFGSTVGFLPLAE